MYVCCDLPYLPATHTHNTQEDHSLSLADYWQSGPRARFHLISDGYLALQV